MIGVVCAGAGARGAYEAGALSVVLPWLAREYPDEPVVMVGTSAGALNSALFAAFLDRSRPAEEAVVEALAVWAGVGAHDVYRPLATTIPGVAVRYALEALDWRSRLPHIRSILDTSPLRRTVETRVDWSRLHENLAGAGRVSRLAVVATEAATGLATVFTDGRPLDGCPPDGRPHDGASELTGPGRAGVDRQGSPVYVETAIDPRHVLASAAIPVAFAPVDIDGRWYVDGGVKLNAPISPALALGADRVVVVATTPDPDPGHAPGREADAAGPAPTAAAQRAPDVFATADLSLLSVLTDRMADDIRQLRRVNRLLEPKAVENPTKPDGNRYRPIDNIYVGPDRSDRISATAEDTFARYYRGLGRWSDPGVLERMLGTPSPAHWDLYSFLFFDRHFHAELVTMGQLDARRAIARGWRA